MRAPDDVQVLRAPCSLLTTALRSRQASTDLKVNFDDVDSNLLASSILHLFLCPFLFDASNALELQVTHK